MASTSHPLHVLLFPFMAQGHILPMLDMAKLFTYRGVHTTVLTTPANAPQFQSFIDRANNNRSSRHQNPIQLSLIPFPSGTGLPEGCENLSSILPNQKPNFFGALSFLRQSFEQVLKDLLPDCVVTSTFFPWTYDVAAELGIPRLTFHGSNFFAQCTFYCIDHYKVLENLLEDVDTIVIPGLPHRIEMLKSQVPNFKKAAPFLVDLLVKMNESSSKSYGDVVNSFHELEPDYVEYCRKVIGRKVWHVGPMCLCNEDAIDMSQRGQNAEGNDHNKYLRWLDSKSPSSVLYVCFGSMGEFTVEQLREIALGLEASNHFFVWVDRKMSEEVLPEGFEERVEGRGLIVRGWAPQMLILNHVAVGGFLTHCGWNSSLEGVSAGLPLITWPLFAEQTYNEKLIVDVLKIGITVGVKEYTWKPEERALVKAERIGEAVDGLMGDGEEAAERRRRAKELGEVAKKAVQRGGSSYVDMESLIQELMERRKNVAI